MMEKKSMIKKVVSYYEFVEGKTKIVTSHFLKLVTFLTTILLLHSTIGGLFEESYQIHPFDVPQFFYENGITGNYVSLELSDKISEIQNYGWSFSDFVIKRKPEVNIEEDIVFLGVSFNSVKSLIRNLFGIEDKAIKGSLITRLDTLQLKINIHNAKSITLQEVINQSQDIYHAYDQVIHKAAIQVLRKTDPFLLASFYWSKEDADSCIFIIDEMIKTKQKDLDHAYILWGEILYTKNEYKDAIDKFKKSTEINSKNELGWNAWGTVLYSMKNRDEEAIDKFKKVIEINSEFWDPWYYWGLILFRMGQNEEAILKLEKAISIDNSKYGAYNEISYVFQAINDLESAIDYLLQGIENSPESGILYATLAEVYWIQNRKQEAFTSLKKSQDLGFGIHEYITIEPYKSFFETANKNK